MDRSLCITRVHELLRKDANRSIDRHRGVCHNRVREGIQGLDEIRAPLRNAIYLLTQGQDGSILNEVHLEIERALRAIPTTSEADQLKARIKYLEGYIRTLEHDLERRGGRVR